MFSWVVPAFPEDLAFYRRAGKLAFATCAHDRMAWAVDLDLAYTLPKCWGFTLREMVEKDMVGDGGFEYVA